MTEPNQWRTADDPAELFLLLWQYVSPMSRERLSSPVAISGTLEPALSAALALDDGAGAVAGICQALIDHWDPESHWRARRVRAGLALAAMRAIDTAIQPVHPRSVIAAVQSKPIPEWLEDVRELRVSSGAFAKKASLWLIARGPFARSPKQPLEEATFSLIDQFACLKVLNSAMFTEDGRGLDINICVVDHSADLGVPHRKDRSASEVVTFAPLAEATDDLVADVSEDEGGTVYIDILKGPTFDPAGKLIDVINDCLDSDIVVAPELTVDPNDVRKISAALAALRGVRPRLLVSGSGLVPSGIHESGFPYNQATILNGNGATLWSHRKISAYGMLKETAEGLKLPGPQAPAQLLEKISWANDVTVADIDGLGRCIVLICQDLMMGAVLDLVKELRPDWIIVPILDSGTSLARWPARRAQDLAPHSEARYVVVSSLSMKEWQTKKYPGEQVGVAVGPTYVNRGDPEEPCAVMTEVSPESISRRHASIRWRSLHGWRTYR